MLSGSECGVLEFEILGFLQVRYLSFCTVVIMCLRVAELQ